MPVISSTSLYDLDPLFYPVAVILLGRFTAAGIKVKIIETRRSAEAHQRNLKKGTSRIKRTLHMDGLAIDVAPTEPPEILKDKDWMPKHPIWERMGKIGELLGLEWGGRWTSPVDKPHFQPPKAELRKVNGIWKWVTPFNENVLTANERVIYFAAEREIVRHVASLTEGDQPA